MGDFTRETPMKFWSARGGSRFGTPRSEPLQMVCIGAVVAAFAACAEPAAPALASREEGAAQLDAAAAVVVRTVLDDVGTRLDDAVENPAARRGIDAAFERMQLSIAAGRLDEASTAVGAVRAMLADAAMHDADGSGDADRAAIELSLGVAADHISNARHRAAGDVR